MSQIKPEHFVYGSYTDEQFSVTKLEDDPTSSSETTTWKGTASKTSAGSEVDPSPPTTKLGPLPTARSTSITKIHSKLGHRQRMC